MTANRPPPPRIQASGSAQRSAKEEHDSVARAKLPGGSYDAVSVGQTVRVQCAGVWGWIRRGRSGAVAAEWGPGTPGREWGWGAQPDGTPVLPKPGNNGTVSALFPPAPKHGEEK